MSRETPLAAELLARDPLVQLDRWLADAVRVGAGDPNAFVLATAGANGTPTARTVLVHGIDPNGLVFHTSSDTQKVRDLTANPTASGVFRWPETDRQVVVEGTVAPVADACNDRDFAALPRDLQILGWVYEHAPGGAGVEVARAVSAQFEARAVPRPPSWIGFRLAPRSVDFWQRAPKPTTQTAAERLNERIRYEYLEDQWRTRRMLP